jgi:cyclic pyranopterin phosphate synthase
MMELTHINDEGRAKMVDVSEKDATLRTATATATVLVNEETFKLITEGRIKKGDVLAVAQVAGIMAAKKCPDTIPMCHPIALTGADISFKLEPMGTVPIGHPARPAIIITATTRCKGETGVEMEALCAASTAALTIYDMCKAVQRDIEITDIKLLTKTGGKSGTWQR